MRLLLLLLLFSPLLNADFLSEHVLKNVNDSVSPCEDFRQHLCGDRFPSDLPKRDWYDNIERLTSDKNDPIINDIQEAWRSDTFADVFNATTYKSILQQRCGNCLHCYEKEFRYFFNLYNGKYDYKHQEVDERLVYFHRNVAFTEENLSKIVSATAGMIASLHSRYDDIAFLVMMVKQPYFGLLSQVSAMSFVFENDNTTDKEARERHELIENVRAEIAKMFRATPWLNETNAFGLAYQSHVQDRLKQLVISFEFEELGKALSYWKMLLRNMASKYFEYTAMSTGCLRFDVIHALMSINREVQEQPKTVEEKAWYNRVDWGDMTRDRPSYYDFINLHAYEFYFHPNEPFKASFAAELAKSILHRFTLPGFNKFTNDSQGFVKGLKCFADRYTEDCKGTKWAAQCFKFPCDPEIDLIDMHKPCQDHAADVEGLRVAYRVLNTHSKAGQIKDLDHQGGKMTRQQAFFYEYGYHYCYKMAEKLNSVVSQLLEFTEAFNCKPKDKEYASSESSCFLYGAKAK